MPIELLTICAKQRPCQYQTSSTVMKAMMSVPDLSRFERKVLSPIHKEKSNTVTQIDRFNKEDRLSSPSPDGRLYFT